MIKKVMVEKTIESFIRKLNKEGHKKYASKLRYIIAMSRKRKDAEIAFTGISVIMLVYILKYIALPQAIDRNKWKRELKAYLEKFDIRNESPKGRPWLSIEFINKDLNDMLSNSKFLPILKRKLEEYSTQDRKKVITLAEANKTIKDLGVKMFYDLNNNLNISINGLII